MNARESKRLDDLLTVERDGTSPRSPVAVNLGPAPSAISLARHLFNRSSAPFTNLDDKMEAGMGVAPIDRVSSANSLSTFEKWDKNDGRLHPEFPLYCEGMLKPACRGMLHMVCALLLPVGVWHLVSQANGHFHGEVVAFIYVLSNFWCYGASAVYHVGKWSPKTEIMLQKMDHTGIAVMSVGTFVPTAVLLFPQWEGILFISMLLAACAWCIQGIVVNIPSLVRQAIVPAISLLFLPRLCVTFNSLELSCYFATIILKGVGIAVFVKQKPDPWPSFFGYHEIWHVFVVLGGVCIYIANWSIILRSCNPYEHNNDLSVILSREVWDE
jgi:hemolysin III